MTNNVELKVGDQAPKFSLLDTNENEVSPDDYAGKWMVLYFYPKDNTSGCTAEAIAFTSRVKEFEKQNTIVLGISPDSCKSHQNFTKKHSLKVNLLSDPGKITLKDYRVWQKKKLYGREYMGVVRTTYLIDPDGKIAEIWHKVKVDGHADEVLKKLAGLR